MSGLYIRLSLFYAAVFTAMGVQLPYWPLYLSDKGMSPVQIGQLIAAGYVIKIITNPLVGHVVDRRGDRRLPMMALAVFAVASVLLFAPAQGFGMIMLVTVLNYASFTALMPLGDNLTMLTAAEHKLDYGRIRLWGSLSFIVTANLAGTFLVDGPHAWILWACAFGQVMTLLAVRRLPDTHAAQKRPSRRPVLPLIRDRRFLLFIAATSLTQVSHMIYYGFATLYWKAAGLPGWVIGALWAEGVIAEVILFAFGNKVVARFGPGKLILAGGLAGVLRWSVLGLTTDPLLLASVQFLHAFTFGATHLGAMHFINKATPPDLSGRAQGIYASVANGVMPGLAMLCSGWLYQSFGGASFWAMTLVSGAGVAISLLLNRRWNGGRILGSLEPCESPSKSS